jgi:hypothetical protein
VQCSGHAIRRLVVSTGAVSTLAGVSATSGTSNGVGTDALFASPNGVAMDAAGAIALVVSAIMVS